MTAADPVVDLLAAALRGASAPWPAPAPDGLEARVAAGAAAHGVAALVRGAAAHAGWPAPVRAALDAAARASAIAEGLRAGEDRRVLEALDGAGVDVLVVKGAALAHTVYAATEPRPRTDTDLLALDDAGFDRAGEALAALGYRPRPARPGDRASRQRCFDRALAGGVAHAVDVHRALSNRPAFAGALDGDALAARAVALPALGPRARTLDPVDALLHACVHRTAHHPGDERLIWLVDVDRLARRAGAEGLAALVARAGTGPAATACVDGLAAARARLATPIPDAVLAGLGATPGRAPRWPRAAEVIADLRALPDWRTRLAWAREHALPPPAYMLRRYGVRSPAWLPALYLRRGVRGTAQLLRRSR